ncbi:MAG: hypothetical protein M0021_09765 [Clostridia bacterium]|nr:hypothetical protein [Clostridia bacterium]
MALLRGDFLSTLRKQIVGKVQLYALKVLADRSAVLDGDGNEQVIELEVVDGRLRSQPESRYQELGLVVEGLNMAAGAIVYGSWIDNAEFVRNIVTLTQSDQQYDVGLNRRDSTLNADSGATVLATNQPAITTAWRPALGVGAAALVGYGVMFYVKNSSTAANTYARVRAQLLGL